MTTSLCTRALTFTLIAPAAALLPAVMPSNTAGLSPGEASALHARFDPSLGSLRAGRVAGPAALGTAARAELRTAQQQSPALAAMRGGSEPSSNDVSWLLIGAAIVVLIVLL